MLTNSGVIRYQSKGFFKRLDGLIIQSFLVIDPTKTIYDITTFRFYF